MSAPAAKARSLPVRTMAPISGSNSRSSRAAPSSSISLALSALSADGRLRRTIPTAPCRSTRTVFSCGSLMGGLLSALLFGAKECRAARLNDAAHALGARATRAGLALAAIDRPAMLEIAELAVGLDIIAQRRTAGLDRLGKHALDRGGELVGPRAGNGAGEASRREAGAIE